MRWLYLLQDVTDAPGPSDLSSTLVKQVDNAIIHVMSNITSNFQLIAHRIPRCGDFIFSTDMNKEGSIKEMERQMRGTSDYIIVLKSKRHSHCLCAQEQGILIQFALAVLTRRFLIVIRIANHNGWTLFGAFYFVHSRVGKIKPLRLIQKTVRFQDILCKLKDVWLMSDKVVIDVEEFTMMCHLWEKSL